MSKREFTKGDCCEWLDTLEDESVNLWVIDPPYNCLSSDSKTKDGIALFKSRYKAKVSPSDSDLNKGMITSDADVAIPWDEQLSLKDYKKTCLEWYVKAYNKLKNNSFMFIFWSIKYLNLAYEIFDVSRVVFWQQPNMVSNVAGDFCYDITPIIIIKKGHPKLNKQAGLWDKSSILKFTKPQGNYKKDKLCHPAQKPQALLEHLVWLSDADYENNIIGDFFAGSGSLLRAVKNADVILCDQNDGYYDKFFDIYVTDENVYKCKKKKL